jgi:sarcosine oxidase
LSFRTRDVDVVVVGLGVLGASALCELARHGVDVVGIEQYQPGHASGSSHGRSRALRFLYDRPGYLELLALALDAWTDLEAATGRQLYWPCGSLFFGRPGNPQLAASLRFSETHGVEVQRLAPNEAARRWPSFALPAGHEGIFLPKGGMLDADACLAATLAEARRAGASVLTNMPIERLELDGERPVVRTVGGALRARHVVVAAGAWTTRLLPQLSLPIRVTQQPFLTCRPRDPATVSPERMPVWCDMETMLYGFPDHGPGLKIAADNPGPDIDPEASDRPIDPAATRRLKANLAARFPTIEIDESEVGTCLYALTPDDDFLLGPVPGVPVSLAVGLGHGFKFAPVIGRVLADLAMTGISRHPIESFRLDRFAHNGVGAEAQIHERSDP